MTLKLIVGQKIMEEVVRYKTTDKNKPSIVWRVLIVDKLGMRMISSCTKMHNIGDEGITIVEDIHKKREPLTHMEAVYLITPCKESVELLIRDFEDPQRPLYKGAHVYFTEEMPDHIFNMLKTARVKKFMKACKEINIAFIPYEQQVFSLDAPETIHCAYSPNLSRSAERITNMERMAEQVATLCSTLGEYPSIRYRKEWPNNLELAELIKTKLDNYKKNDPTMGEGTEKMRSQLLIIDRGFDCVTPLLHELTLQAMAYDLLEINNDVYSYKPTPSTTREVLLDENDDLWVRLKHQHIAVVLQFITKSMKEFTESKRMTGGKSSVKDLSQLIKKMPQYQKELTKYATHLNLAEDCMKAYQDFVDKLCHLEQDLAMGIDSNGEKVRDPMGAIAKVLLEPLISSRDKVRIIALYVMSRNGIPNEHLLRLVEHAQIEKEKDMILNLGYLGVNIAGDGNSQKTYGVQRKERTNIYQLSRWTPVIKDVMEECIEGRLDQRQFPFINNRSINMSHQNAPTSARYGNWRDKAQSAVKNVPRLIIFIVGGMSYSEMRSAYEVTSAVKGWEVIIGSSHILTPEKFLEDLAALNQDAAMN